MAKPEQVYVFHTDNAGSIMAVIAPDRCTYRKFMQLEYEWKDEILRKFYRAHPKLTEEECDELMGEQDISDEKMAQAFANWLIKNHGFKPSRLIVHELD
jgi:hypothetical protein